MSRFNLQSSSLSCEPIFFIITTRQPSLLLSFTATKPIFSTNSFYLKTFGIPGLPNSRSVAHRFIFMVVRFSFKFLCLSRVVDWLHVSCNCLLCVKYTASYLVVSSSSFNSQSKAQCKIHRAVKCIVFYAILCRLSSVVCSVNL